MHARIKYFFAALFLHASVLALPLPTLGPQERIERVIEIVVMRKEDPPAVSRLSEKPQTVAEPSARKQPIQEMKEELQFETPPPSVNPAEKKKDTEQAQVSATPAEKKEEGAEAGGGNVLDEQILPGLPSLARPGKGEDVAIAGMATPGGRVGVGSGGTGSGKGSGLVPGGAATGTGGGSGAGLGAGSTGPVQAGFGQPDGPQFLYRAMPKYPFAARRLRKEGKVLLRVTVNEKGELQKVEVLETSDQMFAASAIDAVKKSTFLPAKRKGMPVASMATLPIRFALQD